MEEDSRQDIIRYQREQMTRDHTDMLIEMYKCEEVLWNTKHQKYFDKNSRQSATQNIISAMEESFSVEFSVDFISNKIQNLRSYYGREHRKTMLAQKNGETYKSKWTFYTALDAFLRYHMATKHSVGFAQLEDFDGNENTLNGENGVVVDDVESEINGESRSELVVVKTEAESNSCNSNGKRKSASDVLSMQNSELPNSRSNVIKKFRSGNRSILDSDEDEDLVFAKYLAFEMRKVTDLRTKQLMKLKLQTVIFEAQTESDET